MTSTQKIEKETRKIKIKMIQNHVARATINFKRVITGKDTFNRTLLHSN